MFYDQIVYYFNWVLSYLSIHVNMFIKIGLKPDDLLRSINHYTGSKKKPSYKLQDMVTRYKKLLFKSVNENN